MFCILSGPEHIFEYVNQAHILALGFDATGMKVKVAQPESVEIHCILDNVYQSGVTANLHEIEVTLGSSKRYFDLTYAPKKDKHGTINGIMILGAEVTNRVLVDQKIAYERNKALSALQIRDEFLSIASHELKTPLTGFNLQLQSAQRRIAKNAADEFTIDKLAVLFTKYKKQTDRLIRLVDDMLDLSKINLGKLTFEFDRIDLKTLIEVSHENFKEQFIDKESSLTIINSHESILGNFDKERMEQVLTNLLSNALKYGAGNPVTIELKKVDQKAQIIVKDRGPGIPVEKSEIIFQKFERVPETLDISGLGIGLYITKEIVEAHQGKIWVESRQGEGSAFIVELPIL